LPVFNKHQLQGIMLASSIPEVIVARDNGVRLGYRVRLRISLRGHSVFLSAIQRSLLQYEIDATYKEKESKARPRPILLVNGLENVDKVCGQLIPDLPCNPFWHVFQDILEMCQNGEHLTQKGLDKILELKGFT